MKVMRQCWRATCLGKWSCDPESGSSPFPNTGEEFEWVGFEDQAG